MDSNKWGHVWNGTMRQETKRSRFRPIKVNPMVYLHFGDKGEIEIAGWYVDDWLLVVNSTKSIQKMIMHIKGSFDIEDMGKPT